MGTKTEQKEITGCCPPFDPSKWEDKVFEWKNKRVVYVVYHLR